MKRRNGFAVGCLYLSLLLSGCNFGEKVPVAETTGSAVNGSGEEISEAAGSAGGKLGEAGNQGDAEGENAVDNPAPDTKNVDNASENTQTTEKQEESSDDEDAAETVSLVMVGDILLHPPVAESGMQEDGTYNFDAVFANTREEISAADLAIVNQEVIIGGVELGITGYPCFNAPYELGDALVKAGFDVVLHATNHALDKGKVGLQNCLNFWENSYPDIAVLGINGSKEAQDTIYVCEQNGIRIAILNYTYGLNGLELPSDMPYGVNLLETEKVIADLEKAGQQADFVVVCPHWGTEYNLGIDENQQYWTRIFLEHGADLVIGTHPHVIEPVEWVRDDNGNEMLVYYSLGNFVSWTANCGEGVTNRSVGGLAQVELARDEQGEVYIAEYGVLPLVCHVEEGIGGVTVYPLSRYTDELEARNAIREQDANFSKKYCEELCEQVWGDVPVSE